MVHRKHRIIAAIVGTGLVLALLGARSRSDADVEDNRFQTIETRFPNRSYDFLLGEEPSADSLVGYTERSHLGTPYVSFQGENGRCVVIPCHELTDEKREKAYSKLVSVINP